MAFDTVVDKTKLETALTATADAIRNKTGETAPLEWNEAAGFADAVTGIPGTALPNGTAWERTNDSLNFTCVEYGDGVWCAGTVGNGVYYSTDGKTWNPTAIMGETVYDIAYNGQYWFAGADTGIYSCSNGTDWSTAEEHKVSFASFKYIVSDHGTCIAVTHSGWICVHRGGGEKVWSSQVQISGASEPAYGDNTWIVGATGQIMVSKDDGVTWTAKATEYTDTFFKQFSYGKGVWIGSTGMIGYPNSTGHMVYSTDRGENWLTKYLSSSANAYGDGLHLRAYANVDGGVTQIFYSTNATLWDYCHVHDNAGIGYVITKFFKYNGVWVALANDAFYTSSATAWRVLYSLDGLDWYISNAPNVPILDVAVGKTEWVAVGSSGSCHSTSWSPN